MKNGLINAALFNQLEAKGQEIRYKKRNKKIVAASIIDPLDKLFKAGAISFEELAASNKYSIDLENSNKTNHSRPIYDGSANSSSTPRDYELTQKQIDATNRVLEIKTRVRQINTHRQRRLKKLVGGISSHNKVLLTLFERRLRISVVEQMTGINHKQVRNKAIAIAQVICNYYKK